MGHLLQWGPRLYGSALGLVDTSVITGMSIENILLRKCDVRGGLLKNLKNNSYIQSNDIYVNDTQFNSGNTHFTSSALNGTEYAGNVLEVQQYLHGMHGQNNVVKLSGIDPNSIPTTINASVDINSTGSISVAIYQTSNSTLKYFLTVFL